jgi:hypothetical protein
MPCSRLSAPRSSTYSPIFQYFVDYRLGQREKIDWAGCQLELTSLQVSKLAYDTALDIIDDPDGDCLIMLIVRKEPYSQQDANTLVRSYERWLTLFHVIQECLSTAQRFLIRLRWTELLPLAKVYPRRAIKSQKRMTNIYNRTREDSSMAGYLY